MPTKRTTLAAAMPLLLLAIVSLYYWKLTIKRQYTWLDSPDFAYQVLPWYQFQAAEWHAGRIPLWSPYEWAGQSLIGQAQPGVAYPLNWALFLMPLRNGWMRQLYLNWYWVLIHYFGSLFAYLLCRDLHRSRSASLLGGLAFGLGGYMGSIEWPQMLNGAAWIPAVMLFLFRVLRRERPLRHAALAGSMLGMAFLSGHHQAPTYIALAAGGVWLYAFAVARPRRSLIKPLAAFAILFALVGALQVLPAYEYGKLAVRWVGSSHDPVTWKEPVPYAVHTGFGLSPRTVVGILIPSVYRHAKAHIGIAVIALALIAVAARWRDRQVRVLAAIALGGLLFSLGNFTVFHGILYSLVPMVEKARNVSMAILVFHFGAAILAAHGLDSVLEREQLWSRRAALAAASFALFLGLACAVVSATLGRDRISDRDRVLLVPALAAAVAGVLYAARSGRLGRRAVIPALTGIALVEFTLSGAHWGWRRADNPNSLLRKLSADAGIAEYLYKLPGPPRVEIDMDAVPYNFGEWYGIDAYDTYTASMQANTFSMQANTPARMLFAIGYYIGPKPSRKEQVEIFSAPNGLKIFVNPRAAPRAWSVHDAARIPPAGAPFQFDRPLADLRAKPFLLADPPPLDRCPGNDIVRMTRREPSRIVVEAEMACRGMVVVSEPFFPGWQATVDGRAAPIHEVYGALRAVALDAGVHRIEMRYRPLSVIAGAVATGLGWLLTLALFAARPRAPAALLPAEPSTPLPA